MTKEVISDLKSGICRRSVMKKIICEVCGSDQFEKQDGKFICQTCGMAYGAADVKKLLTEVPDEGAEEGAKEALPASAVEQTPAKVKKSQGKVAVVSQGATVSNEDNMKLQYDLYCWYAFYEKCHELERTEPFPDKELERCGDIASSKYPGSIVERELTFNKKKHYKEEVYPQVREHYLKEHPEFKEQYDALVEDYNARKAANEEKNKNTQENMKKATKVTRRVRIGTMLWTVFVPMIALIVVLYVTDLVWAAILSAVFSVGIGILVSEICTSKIRGIESKYALEGWVETLPKEEQWIEENVFAKPEFLAYEKEKHAKYDELIDSNVNAVREGCGVLSEIHGEMLTAIPLPDRYRDEYHVQCLLALVTDRRADTLKEAINLLETENYRSNVIGSLQQLNNHLRALTKSISALGDMVYQGFSGVMKQNALINARLTALQYSQEAMFATAMIFR